MFSSILNAAACFFSKASSVACPNFWIDEPEMPESLIK